MAEINALDLLGGGTSAEGLICPKNEDEYAEEINVKQELEEDDYGESQDSQLARQEPEGAMGYLQAYYSGGVAAHLLMGDDNEEEEQYNDEIKPGTSEEIKPFQDLDAQRDVKDLPELTAETTLEIYEEENEEDIPDEQGKDWQRCAECRRTIYFSSKKHEWSRKCEHVLMHIPSITFGCGRCGYKSRTKPEVFRHLREKHGGVFYYPAVTHGSVRDHNIFQALLLDCFPQTHVRQLFLPSVPPLPGQPTVSYYMIYIPDVPKVMKWMINRLPELDLVHEALKRAEALQALKDREPPVQPKVSVATVAKRRNDLKKCTSCKTLISGGPLEWQLKCEHAMAHMGIKWLSCDLCPVSGAFSSDDAFSKHARETHPGQSFKDLRRKIEINGEMLVAVETLVKRFFIGSVKPGGASPGRPTASAIVTETDTPIITITEEEEEVERPRKRAKKVPREEKDPNVPPALIHCEEL